MNQVHRGNPASRSDKRGSHTFPDDAKVAAEHRAVPATSEYMQNAVEPIPFSLTTPKSASVRGEQIEQQTAAVESVGQTRFQSLAT